MLLSFCSIAMWSQSDTITLRNPSFEDAPRAGGKGVTGIYGWYDCGIRNFPDETPPDIHPNNYWNNTKHAADGKTYLGMVVRDNDTWESVAQRLSSPMKAGECYSFSVKLSKSRRYLSGSRLEMEMNANDKIKVSYTTPIVLRIWGGTGYCDTKELLGETVTIKNSDWKTYTFKFSPSFNFKYIMLEAFYKVPVINPYNGHILVDNCSDLIKMNCSEEILVDAEEPKKKLPPHKRFKKRPKAKPAKKEEESVVVAAPAATKKILDLDRDKMKKGQTIEIKNLYFKADVASINSDSYNVLDEVYDFLNSNSDITVEIGGHTNGVPPHAYCDKLSTERAKEVAVYLVDKGIDGDRIYYKGYGKRKAIASDRTKEGKRKNQRVEIKILSIG